MGEGSLRVLPPCPALPPSLPPSSLAEAGAAHGSLLSLGRVVFGLGAAVWGSIDPPLILPPGSEGDGGRDILLMLTV